MRIRQQQSNPRLKRNRCRRNGQSRSDSFCGPSLQRPLLAKARDPQRHSKALPRKTAKKRRAADSLSLRVKGIFLAIFILFITHLFVRADRSLLKENHQLRIHQPASDQLELQGPADAPRPRSLGRLRFGCRTSLWNQWHVRLAAEVRTLLTETNNV